MNNSLSLRLYLASRARRDAAGRRELAEAGEEGKTQERERLGQATEARADGPLIWIHTGADRHALAARELAHRLRAERPDLLFLLTTSAKKRKASEGYMAAQFAPDENRSAIRGFLDHWRPDVSVWTEPDMRPALIADTDARGIPLFFVDARTAHSDPQTWRWFRGMSGAILERFQQVLTGDADSAAALRRLGASPKRIEIAGFLEEGTAALPCNDADRDAIAADLAGRPVWLAITTPEEIPPVLAAHRQAIRRSHRLLLILAPLDPQDGGALLKTVREQGFSAELRSTGAEPGRDTQVYVADTEGELGLWYRLAPIAFLGRSLEATGGINPFEAAALGSAIIHGPNARSFRQAFSRLSAAGAARMVRSGAELAEAVEHLLSPDVAARMAHDAWRVCSTGAEVTDRAKDLILTTVDERETV